MAIVLGLAACGTPKNQTEQTPSAEESVSQSTENQTGSSSEEPDTDVSASQPEETEAPEADDTSVLVAYFSATGTTEGVAEHIASGLGADLYEIVPEEPYTDADLNYNDNNSRSTIEMNDPDARPAISGSVDNMEQYDIVFVGYPKMQYGI